MRHSTFGTQICDVYANCLLGGHTIKTSYESKSTDVPAAIFHAVQQDVNSTVKAVSSLRPLQPVLDILVRNASPRLCVPHLPTKIASVATRWSATRRRRDRLRQKSNRRWSVRRKTQSDLASLLWYALRKCNKRGRYIGALLPYSVSIHQPNDHANMILLDFHNTPIRCVLVEPNGPTGTRKHPDGLKRLTAAWGRVVTEESGLDPTVHVLGETGPNADEVARNLHTIVGRRRSTYREGYGICAAITHWIVHTWVTQGTTSLEDHYAKMCDNALADTAAAKRRVLAFIVDVTARLQRTYETTLHEVIARDLRRLERRLCKEWSTGRFEAKCRFTVCTRNKRKIYDRTHTVVAHGA
jgi:hypothetical protein